MQLQTRLIELSQTFDVADTRRQRLRDLADDVAELETMDFEAGFAALLARTSVEAVYAKASPSRLSRRSELTFGGTPGLRDFMLRLLEAGARAEYEQQQQKAGRLVRPSAVQVRRFVDGGLAR